MDRRAQLLSHGESLAAAARAADWTALAAADRALADGLPRLAAQGPFGPAERAALQRLKAVHDEARRCCAEALSQLGQRLEAMRAHREGWLAYAADGDPSHTGNEGLR